RAQLLLRPGDCGIPLADGPEGRLVFADLVSRRNEPWIPGFARNKIAALRLLAVGRERRFGAVVEAYCRFLDALVERKEPSALRTMLSRAEKDFETLHLGLNKEADRSRDAGRESAGQ
ncbi:MAG: hypothetical protein HQ559_17275, partial [Lentisphaerae bacterium]|nr:hypothetical protein [Lentisphaerota bacterium]